MHPSRPLSLSPEDKLDALRSLDEFHFWHSLDDRRNCKRCGRSISGRQILVLELKGTRGRLRLQCPTVGCISTPSEWVYADPVLAARLKSGFGLGAQKFESAKDEGLDIGYSTNLRKRALNTKPAPPSRLPIELHGN